MVRVMQGNRGKHGQVPESHVGGRAVMGAMESSGGLWGARTGT
jgi:hypothetical protein